ncbi:aminotransferase class V-fold PLP-dependent enzyme [Lyngbya confervoides]|uniref:Aminotransferase class V-fold PLP-dependent enzyme n=1 Tax=Lyngbya confervoides BDU141951 TaxID=1574623 RepID=A0ABD4SZM7_9CYAN|nr:aminotransferase class V-fold PLP-dependent enzyme [Lyngbya confervoides]MCM1981611.1 aminotransferase class V-fold PLP-dependent enzyme [Lyngbya confervoides BDU141951]
MTAALGTAASGMVGAAQPAQASKKTPPSRPADLDAWEIVRAQFNLDPNYIHMAGLLLAAHPVSVQEAIASHRNGLDHNPTHYLYQNRPQRVLEVRRQASQYLGVEPHDLALTDSTTMGTALVINGLRIRPDQEMLTTEFDYYSTHTALEYKALRTGAKVVKIPLYQDIHTVSEDEMVETLMAAVGPKTRFVTATWVHSNTGLKVPVARIARRLADLNAHRDEADRALLFVDGVHGLGVEPESLSDLDCDFFVAGTHKWIFAPRGTGILWGNPRSQAAVTPTIPTFTRGAGWGGWMTPGGFKSFEHQWAMAEAFAFHRQMGKTRVSQRLHELSQQIKQGLARMKHVTLYTPIDQRLSAAIVCFDLAGMDPSQVVLKLQAHKIIASTTPYEVSYARLTPGIYNTPEEVDRVLRVIGALT